MNLFGGLEAAMIEEVMSALTPAQKSRLDSTIGTMTTKATAEFKRVGLDKTPSAGVLTEMFMSAYRMGYAQACRDEKAVREAH